MSQDYEVELERKLKHKRSRDLIKYLPKQVLAPEPATERAKKATHLPARFISIENRIKRRSGPKATSTGFKGLRLTAETEDNAESLQRKLELGKIANEVYFEYQKSNHVRSSLKKSSSNDTLFFRQKLSPKNRQKVTISDAIEIIT
jgi:hypothetical protein